MKTLWIFLGLFAITNFQTRTYTFIGRFEGYDVGDLCSSAKFVARSGESKTFFQCEYWNGRKFDFQDVYGLQYKWFEIKYFSVYENFEDDGKKRWFRRIKALRMIRPKGPNIIQSKRSQLRFLTLWDNEQFVFEFNEKGNYYTVECDSSGLKKLPFDFSNIKNFEKTYAQKWFEVVYRADYELDSKAPATRRLISLTLLEQ
jgi:hypothetical protein